MGKEKDWGWPRSSQISGTGATRELDGKRLRRREQDGYKGNMKAYWIHLCKWGVLAGVGAGLLLGCSRNDSTPDDDGATGKEWITVASLAASLADPLEVARMDRADTILHSSYDRSGANEDYGTFLRNSSTPGWKVIADLKGPGYLSRFWFTGAKDGAPHRFRFYFDGESTPRFEGDVKEWCGGTQTPFLAPLAEYKNYCWYSFVPMPYAKSLRVECEAGPAGAKVYYQLSEMRLPRGSRVESFSWPLPERDVTALENVRTRWASGEFPAEGDVIEAELRAGDPPLVLEGGGVVRRVEFTPDWNSVPPEERDSLLRDLRIGIRYGSRGEASTADESVWSPLGDLCGMPWRRTRTQSLYFGMKGESLFCAFPMPFADRMEWAIDFGPRAKTAVRLRIWKTPLPADGMQSLGYFHAAWKRTGAKEIGSPHSILNVKGDGKYVGCLLSVCTLDGSFWALEGDESIRKDGEKTPGWLGTGLEDYFNGGWYYQNVMSGPTHGLFIKEPFRTVQYRVHAMDPSYFRKSFDMAFERGPDHASRATFESIAWTYLRTPQKADSIRLAPAYRRMPSDPRLDPLNALFSVWNFERLGDLRGARDEWALRLQKQAAAWPPAHQRLARLRLALYDEALASASNPNLLNPFLGDSEPAVRDAARILQRERDTNGITATLYANMAAELFIDGQRILQTEDPTTAAATSLTLSPGPHLFAIRTALQPYPDWVQLALRRGAWVDGTGPEWKYAIQPPADAVTPSFDDQSWPVVGGTGVKGPPEEPYVQIAPDPWIHMQSRALGIRPCGDKPPRGTVVYRATLNIP